jgi:hypothetical protein
MTVSRRVQLLSSPISMRLYATAHRSSAPLFELSVHPPRENVPPGHHLQID